MTSGPRPPSPRRWLVKSGIVFVVLAAFAAVCYVGILQQPRSPLATSAPPLPTPAPATSPVPAASPATSPAASPATSPPPEAATSPEPGPRPEPVATPAPAVPESSPLASSAPLPTPVVARRIESAPTSRRYSPPRTPTPAPGLATTPTPAAGVPPTTVYEFPAESVTGDLIKPGAVDAAESALESLSEGELAFNVPEGLRVDQTQVLQLVVSFGRKEGGVAGEVTEPGRVETAPTKVASLMQAHLTGSDGIEIVAVTPEEQVMSRRESTEWRWNVTPKTAGRHRLQLAVSAVVRVESSEKRRTLKVYSRQIEVVADRSLRNNLLLAGLALALVGGSIAALVRRRRTHARVAAHVRRAQGAVATDSTEPIDLFVSYSRQDLAIVQPIVSALEKGGLRVWLDVHGIEGATQWAEQIAHGMRRTQAVVLMCSPRAFASEFVGREIALAVEEGKPIIPVELEPASAPTSLRLHLAGLQRISADAAAPENTAAAIERALRRLTEQATKTGRAIGADRDPP